MSVQALGVGIFFAMDKLLKDAFVAQSITFPSALGGMFIILGECLLILCVGSQTNKRGEQYYDLALCVTPSVG